MLTIVVPVRNESENLRGVFSYFNDNLQKVNFEVIFINDFSSDNTLKKIEELNQEYKNFKVFDNKRKGLGGAISLGIEKARGDYVAIMMADQSDDINDLIEYHKLIQSEEYDAILGSRFLKNSFSNPTSGSLEWPGMDWKE